jgi:hypothetical protein
VPYVDGMENPSEAMRNAVRWLVAEGFVTHAEHILDVLTYVRRSHGGVEAYVLAGGVGADQLDRVRRRLISSGG